MNLYPVDSYNLESVGYENSILYISFHRDGTYCYIPITVPLKSTHSFLKAL